MLGIIVEVYKESFGNQEIVHNKSLGSLYSVYTYNELNNIF